MGPSAGTRSRPSNRQLNHSWNGGLSTPSITRYQGSRSASSRGPAMLPLLRQAPAGGEQAGGQEQLQRVSHDERREPELERASERHVERLHQPGDGDRVQHDLAEEHRADRAAERSVPPTSREPTDHRRGREEPPQVSPRHGREPEERSARVPTGEERQAERTLCEVERHRDGPEPGTEQEDPERLPGDGDGRERQRELERGESGDEPAPRERQQHPVGGPGTDPGRRGGQGEGRRAHAWDLLIENLTGYALFLATPNILRRASLKSCASWPFR